MKIKVSNNSELVFEGDSRQWLKDNQGDAEVLEMITEIETAGSSTKEFFHSGKWEVITIGWRMGLDITNL